MHSDAIPLSRQIGASIQFASDAAFLTDTTVAAADTNAGVISAVDASVVHQDLVPAKSRVDRAVSFGSYDGTLTDANILSLMTVQGLHDLTQGSGDTFRSLLLG